MDSHWICPKSVRPPATQSLAWVAIWQSGNLRGGDLSKKTLTSACKGFWNGVKCSENRSSPTACKAPFPRRHPSPPGAMHFSSQAHNPPFLAQERFTKKSDSPTHRSLSSPVLPTISCRLSHMLVGNLAQWSQRGGVRNFGVKN